MGYDYDSMEGVITRDVGAEEAQYRGASEDLPRPTVRHGIV